MMPAAPTPAPIHDIAGPVWFLPVPLWMLIVGGLLAIGLLVLAVKGILALVRRRRPLTPREVAVAALESLRSRQTDADPYAFGIEVSDAIRNYLRDQYRLSATTQTSLEFLDSIRDNPAFTANEKAGLSVFLDRTDLLKFARASADSTDLVSLLEVAGRLVRGEQQATAPKGGAA